MYYTYMLRCEDNSIYTGMTTDVERRMSEHSSKGGISSNRQFFDTHLKV